MSSARVLGAARREPQGQAGVSLDTALLTVGVGIRGKHPPMGLPPWPPECLRLAQKALVTGVRSQRELQGPAHFLQPLFSLTLNTKPPSTFGSCWPGVRGCGISELAPRNSQDMRVTGIPFPTTPIGPECPHPSQGGPQALTTSRIQSEKMQAGGPCRAVQRLAVWG